MASVVDICNLALAHLGDNATVASISPPEGSAQAEHCARFYPIARDSLLNMHAWSFAMRRASLAAVANAWSTWQYAYALPADCLTAMAVLAPDAADDYSTHFTPPSAPTWYFAPTVAAGTYAPQNFTVEAGVVYTNQENAVLRYLGLEVDTTRYPPLFVMALSWHLASMLAGPLIKGDVGAAEARRCTSMMAAYLAQARSNDSAERQIKPEHIVGWVAGR